MPFSLWTQNTRANEQIAEIAQPTIAGQWLFSRSTRGPNSNVSRHAARGQSGIRRINQSTMRLPRSGGGNGADRLRYRCRMVGVLLAGVRRLREISGSGQVRPFDVRRVILSFGAVDYRRLVGLTQL